MDQLSNVLLPGCQWDNGSIGEDDYEFLNNYLISTSNIIEFGPGMSTVAFARAGHSVISIEANRKWHGFWKSSLAIGCCMTLESMLVLQDTFLLRVGMLI